VGSKGSQTTTNQTQTYTPNAAIGGAGNQAISMAQSAASQPFNLPQAPVAGFQGDQTQAFQQYRDLQGMAQPYYNQASGYINNSAQPITGADVNQYYNPMASSVLANLHESQGQQMHDLTGRMTQAAGGVGADRIAVGQGELGRQQSLAEGQTLSGLYQNALNAAQQNKQMQANAGYGLTNLGTTAQGAAIQGAGILNQSGNQQQAQQQNVLNSPYQNQLAQLAYPFQTAQYLAGITGGLSGAMGGTTTGTGTSQGPAPSIWSQILGGGTAIAGGLGASGAFGNNGWLGNAMGTNAAYGNGNGEYGGSSSNPLPGLDAGDYGAGYADGGGVMGSTPSWMDAADMIVPDMKVQSQASPGAHLDLNPNKGGGGGGGGGSELGDIAKIASTVATIAPMLSDRRAKENIKEVGKTHDGQKIYRYNLKGSPQTQMGLMAQEVEKVHPEAVGKRGGYKTVDYAKALSSGGIVNGPGAYAFGGSTFDERFNGGEDNSGPSFDDRFSGSNPLTGMFAADGGDGSFNTPLGDPPSDFANRFAGDGGGSMGDMSRGTALAHYLNDPNASKGTNDFETAGSINPDDPVRLDPSATDKWRQDNPLPVVAASDVNPASPSSPMKNPAAAAAPRAGAPTSLAAPQVKPDDYTSLDKGLPYPDLDPKNDVSRNFAKSPWMALISAGAGMMSGTSPYAGINIGKGLQSGVKTLEEQRSALATEEGVNQRAKQLMQQAQFHLDQYTKMTPYQQAEIANRKEMTEIAKANANLKGWVAGPENMVNGEKTFMKPSTGEVRIIKSDGSVISGNIDDPSSFTKTGKSGAAVPVSKEEQPPPPMGQKELSSDLKPPENAINPSIYRKGSPALAQATQEMKNVTQLHTKEANNLGNEKLLVDNSKQAYGVLMKDQDQDGFLTKLATMRGNNVDERVRYARSLNEAARAAGKPPVINPEKIAAMEVISKDQKTLGMLFASNLSSREAFAGQQVGIESTPGLTQSPLGMLRLLAGYDAQLQYTTDKHAFFTNYIKKYGVATGWEQAFDKQNPPDRYVVRSMMENLPNRRAAEKLPEAVKILREHRNNPDVVKGFNKNYGNTASFWLNGKLDLLGAQ